jgi:hypothetical protein
MRVIMEILIILSIMGGIGMLLTFYFIVTSICKEPPTTVADFNIISTDDIYWKVMGTTTRDPVDEFADSIMEFADSIMVPLQFYKLSMNQHIGFNSRTGKASYTYKRLDAPLVINILSLSTQCVDQGHSINIINLDDPYSSTTLYLPMGSNPMIEPYDPPEDVKKNAIQFAKMMML